MSDTSPFGFGKFVPGFDFLQSLAKGASGSLPHLPHLSHWVAPTISVEELEKRVEELKAVQFWLEQNSRALAATIQALEVQKMTLATLQGMNFSLGDVANAFKLKTADAVMGGMQKAAQTASDAAQAMAGAASAATRHEPPSPSVPPPAPAAQAEPAQAPASAPQTPEPPEAPAGGVVDPMQWWGALTQQFQHIAAQALKDGGAHPMLDAAKNTATGLAQEALKTATGMATQMAGQMAEHMAERWTAGGGAAASQAKASRAPAKKASASTKTATKKAAGAPSKTAPRAAAPAAARKAAPRKAAAKAPAARKSPR